MVFYLRTWGEERRGEMHGNSNMETYTTRSKTDRQQEFTVCLRELKRQLCINLEGWEEEEMGGRLNRQGARGYLWSIHLEN